MTLDDADNLLIKWAAWCRGELNKLKESKSKWQMDYRSDWPDEPRESDVEPGDDIQMLDVDTALSMLKINQPLHYAILVSRYRHGAAFSFMQLDAAKKYFIQEFISPLDADGFLVNSSFRGRSVA